MLVVRRPVLAGLRPFVSSPCSGSQVQRFQVSSAQSAQGRRRQTRCRSESPCPGAAPRCRCTMRTNGGQSRGEKTTCTAPASRNSHWLASNPRLPNTMTRAVGKRAGEPRHPGHQHFQIRAGGLHPHEAGRAGRRPRSSTRRDCGSQTPGARPFAAGGAARPPTSRIVRRGCNVPTA